MLDENDREQAGGDRQIISSKEEARAAVVTVAGLANRGLAILTPDLEPDIYDHDDFLETLKKFLLARSFARVRVLISDPSRTLKIGNRFVDMGRRLNSYIEFRNMKPELRHHSEAFCLADDRAIMYRSRADRWDGMLGTHEPAVTKKYLDIFDELWQACEVSSELRQLQV
jgi:hypothetical protein